MKKIILVAFLLTMTVSCDRIDETSSSISIKNGEKSSAANREIGSIALKYEIEVSENDKYIIDVPSSIIQLSENTYTLNEENLRVVHAINQVTGTEIKVYLPKDDFLIANNKSLPYKPRIQSGYGDDGYGCIVYGTYYYGDNDDSIFVPCGTRCVGFAEFCPPEGGAFV